MMSRIACTTVFAVALSLTCGAPLFAGIVTNPGFETGDLSGWTVTNPTQVTVIGSTSVTANNGNTWNISPAGSWMAQVVGQSQSAASLDSFFGLAANTIESQVSGASYGDGILQTVTGNAGDQISMAWSLVETDYPPYNDTVFVVVNQGSTNVLYENLGCLVSGCPHVVGNGGTQPWTTFTYTLPANGSYTIGFGAVNTSDAAFDPYLFLDSTAGSFVNPSAVPEPSTFLLLSAGLLSLLVFRRRQAA